MLVLENFYKVVGIKKPTSAEFFDSVEVGHVLHLKTGIPNLNRGVALVDVTNLETGDTRTIQQGYLYKIITACFIVEPVSRVWLEDVQDSLVRYLDGMGIGEVSHLIPEGWAYKPDRY